MQNTEKGKLRRGKIIPERGNENYKKEGGKLNITLEFIETIVSESPVGISIYDESGQCTIANDTFAKQIGATRKQVLEQNYHHINSWKKSGLLDKAKKAVLKNSKQHHEIRVKSTFGVDIGIDCHFVPFLLDDKKYLLLMVNDIKERFAAEDDLRKSEEKFKQFFENAPEYSYIVSPSGTILNINKEALKILGYTKDEITGNPLLTTIYAPSSQKKAKKIFSEWMKGKKIKNQELNIITKDGLERTVLLSVDSLKEANGNLISSISMQRDITELKKAEVALKESEQHYQNLFNSMREGFALCEIICDKKGNPIDYRFLKINPAFGEQSGMDYKDSIGKTIKEIYPDIEQIWIDKYCEVAINQKPIHFTDYNHNTDKYYDVSAFSPSKGKFAMLFKDVTKSKNAEQELQLAKDGLEELLYIASHDLQTPLLSMSGFTKELMTKHSSDLSDEGKFYLKRIDANADIMYKLVISLLDLSKLNTHENLLKTFNPVMVVNMIIKELLILMKEHGTKITVGEIPDMYADKKMIATLFRNLITNSINYGGKNIIVGYENDAYFVRDDGIGIPPSQLEKIFKPGERLMIADAEGVGMGLVFCKKVIKQHNGLLWAESEGEGKGSTFYFKIINEQK